MPLRADLQRGRAGGAAVPTSGSGGDRRLKGWPVEKLEPRMAAAAAAGIGSGGGSDSLQLACSVAWLLCSACVCVCVCQCVCV